MIELADRLARWLWYWMLRFVRLPAIRRMQDWPTRKMPRKEAREWLKRRRRSERFARKIGVPLIRLSLLLIMLSIAFTLTWHMVLWIFSRQVGS